MKPLRKFLVVGLVRNCASSVRADVARLAKALSPSGDVRWLLVESDSGDDTLEVLGQLRQEIAGFDYCSLGRLRDRIPQRTARIAHCRNVYLEALGTNPT